MKQSEYKLPKGYKWDDARVSPVEIYELFRRAEICRGPDLPDIVPEAVDEMWEEMSFNLLVMIGVRTRRQQLAALATLSGFEEAPRLSYMAVDPDHRHRGIGKFLIVKRLEIAQSLGAKSLRTSLAPSNTLKPFYVERGFREVFPGIYELPAPPAPFS